jgi:hypothetical protein
VESFLGDGGGGLYGQLIFGGLTRFGKYCVVFRDVQIALESTGISLDGSTHAEEDRRPAARWRKNSFSKNRESLKLMTPNATHRLTVF